MIDLASRRLRAQRLVGTPLPSALDVVRLFGAVQAQDYAGATWALSQRTAGVTAAEIDRLFDEGRILRTHVMRPTWHFVLPEDARWLLDLTGPRVLRSLAGRTHQLGIRDSDVARALELFMGALSGGRSLTRAELGEVLRAAGISSEGQRLPHLLMAAELNGTIISGPRRGKQFTYGLLAERAPGAGTPDRDAALAEIARRYFRSHGPAQLQDFVWWSGLTATDARIGLGMVAGELESCPVEGKDYWYAPGVEEGTLAPVAHLLPNWDEYTVGYRDREAVLSPERPFDPALFAFGSVLSNVVTLTGRVCGSWRRTVSGGRVRIEVRPLGRFDHGEMAAVEEAIGRFGRFMGNAELEPTVEHVHG